VFGSYVRQAADRQTDRHKWYLKVKIVIKVCIEGIILLATQKSSLKELTNITQYHHSDTLAYNCI
jgi:hypothetical protein